MKPQFHYLDRVRVTDEESFYYGCVGIVTDYVEYNETVPLFERTIFTVDVSGRVINLLPKQIEPAPEDKKEFKGYEI